MQVMIIGRWAKPIRSDSVFYNLSPVPRLTRYQRRQCILNQREYIVNLIGGDLSMMENRFKIVVSDWPHLVYVATFQDLLVQQKKLSSHSSTGTKMATKYFALVHSLTARSNEITHHSELKGMMEFRKEK